MNMFEELLCVWVKSPVLYAHEWYSWILERIDFSLPLETPPWFSNRPFKLAFSPALAGCVPNSACPPAWLSSVLLILAILTGVRWNLIVFLIWIFLMLILTLDTVELRTGNFILAKRNLKIICSVLLDVKFHKHILITFIPYSSPQLLTDLPTPIHFMFLFCFIISFCLVLRKLRFSYLRKLLSRYDLMRINKQTIWLTSSANIKTYLSIVNFMSYHHLQTADI